MGAEETEPVGDVARAQLTIALVVTALVAAAVFTLDAYVLPALDLTTASSLHFLSVYESFDYLKPEPLEQQRYLVAVLAALALPFLVAFGASRHALLRAAPTAILTVLQVAVVALVALTMYADGHALERLLPATRSPSFVLVVALATALLLARRGLTDRLDAGGRRWEVVCASVALLATGLLCLAGFYTDGSLLGALVPTGAHVPFTFEEVHAVAAGRTPLVDWTPQYTSVLPYLLAPLLSLRPFGIAPFTGAMVATSIVALVFGYIALRLLAGRPLRALALYLPVLAIGLIPAFELGDQAHSIAAYYALMPLRYGGPLACLCAVAVVGRFGSGGRREWLALGFLAGATLLNNVEFGLPAAAATGFVAVLCAVQRVQGPSWRAAVLRTAGWLAVGGGASVAGFLALTFARSGELPDFGQLVYFSRQFATAGFFMIPIDTVFGLPGLIFATFVAAIALGAVPVLLGARASDAHGLVRTAVLVFTGVFGLGVFAYWVGRSVDETLAATFLAWALALAALAAEGTRVTRTALALRAPGGMLHALAVVLFAVVGLAALREATYGFEQPKRIAKHERGVRIAAQLAVLDFTRRCITPGTDVGMYVPYGLRVAHEAGLQDWFAYNNPTSVVTQEQVDNAFDVFAEHDVQFIVVGNAPMEWTQAMGDRGYRRLRSGENPVQVGYTAIDTGPILEIWGIEDHTPLRCPPDS